MGTMLSVGEGDDVADVVVETAPEEELAGNAVGEPVVEDVLTVVLLLFPVGYGAVVTGMEEVDVVLVTAAPAE